MILENNRKKVTIIKIIFIAIIIIAIAVGIIIFVDKRPKNENSTASSETTSQDGDEDKKDEQTIFAIDNIILYSSANAINNSDTQKDYWNLGIYQYTDISLSINNHMYSSKLTSKNLVKKLYIDNLSFSVKPALGTPGLFYKNPNSLGVPKINDLDNQITDRMDFEVNSTNDSVDYTKPSFYTDCSNPLTLSYVNSNVYSSFIVKNGRGAVTFDGSLLKKSSTKLENIAVTINFTIHLTNANDDEFVCDVSLPLKFEDENSSIYDGHYVQEINDKENYKFIKVEKEFTLN